MPYCTNCGNELPDGTKFCPNCGAAVGAAENASAPENAPAPEIQAAKAEPIKQNRAPLIIICAALVLAVAVVLAFLIGRQTAADSDISVNGTDDSAVVSFDSVDDATSEFNAFFDERGIEHTDFAFDGFESAAFVCDTDGTIDCLEFGYKNDIVYEMTETIYIDISDVAEADRDAFDGGMRDSLDVFNGLPFAEISYEMRETLYVVTVKVHDLDNGDILASAIEMQLLSVDSDEMDYISMSATEDALVSSGYIKR